GIHFDGFERTNLDADLAAHANRDVDVETGGIELRFDDVVRLLVLALLDVNALGRTFLFTDLARHTPQAGVRISGVEDQERELPRGFLERNPFLGIFHRGETTFVCITADEIPGRLDHALKNSAAQHGTRDYMGESGGGNAECRMPPYPPLK